MQRPLTTQNRCFDALIRDLLTPYVLRLSDVKSMSFLLHSPFSFFFHLLLYIRI